jgi:thiamine biosynthesis lipoprotein
MHIGTSLALRPLAAVAALALLCACGRESREMVVSGPAMGTTWTLRAVPGEAGPDTGAVRSLVEQALAEVDESMSGYRPDSALSRFNASVSTDWVDVPSPLAAVVGQALRIGAVTDGAFDITVSPLVSLWGFGTGTPREQPPADHEVAAARTLTGLQHLEVRTAPPALRKGLPGLRLDLDAIAPGYAVDLLAERLEAAGIGRYMIEVGGEVRVRGHNAQGKPWRIGIERPDERGRSVARVLHLESMAVSTSGDYRDFFEANGARYSHTLDPRSGRPVSHGLASVTVLRPTALEADALATALMVLGPVEGLGLAERRGWAALFVERTPGGLRPRETTAFRRLARGPESAP